MSHNPNAGRNNNGGPRWGGGPQGQHNTRLPEPKNEANRLAWERLKQKYDSASSDNQGKGIAKAVKSLAASKEPITTYHQALELVHVGPKFAQIICPLNQGEAPATGRAKPAASKKRKAPTDHRTEGDLQRHSKKSVLQEADGPSTKERKYQTAKQDAIARWSHPIAGGATDGLVWKVLLLVDGREPKSQHVLSKCGMSGIPAEERMLPIGDMTWIAQGLRKQKANGKLETIVEVELLLGTIIERKTTADLVSSLFGTRYMEQRLRLQHCGLPQVLFLIEGDIQKDVHPCFSKESLQMALIETRVYLGFQMVRYGSDFLFALLQIVHFSSFLRITLGLCGTHGCHGTDSETVSPPDFTADVPRSF